MRVTLVAIAALSVAGPGCRGSPREEAQEVTPELQLTGVRFRIFGGGSLRASGEAERVTLRRDSTEVSASGLSALLPGEGQDPVRITAVQGQGAIRGRSFSASGGVTVARGDDVVRTDSARYEPFPGRGVVRGETPVAVQGKGYQLSGPGFELDPAARQITIRGGARLEAGLAGAP